MATTCALVTELLPYPLLKLALPVDPYSPGQSLQLQASHWPTSTLALSTPVAATGDSPAYFQVIAMSISLKTEGLVLSYQDTRIRECQTAAMRLNRTLGPLQSTHVLDTMSFITSTAIVSG